jgi:uncharacterized membrane protein YphA (DoxX/SURF4 family)
MPTLDPTIDWLIRGALASLFAASAIHKLRDLSRHGDALLAYGLIPGKLVPMVATAGPIFELTAAVLLVVPSVSRLGAVAILVLLLVYTLAVTINLVRGRRDIDCGCVGPANEQPLSYFLVSRNIVLISLAAASLLPLSGRGLHPVDAVSLVGGFIVTALIWHAAHVLGANQRMLPGRRPS